MIEAKNEKNFGDLLDEYSKLKRLRFEGERGVRHLNDLCNAIGYDAHGFAYGSSLEVFLADNPGAQAAIVKWIERQNIGEWKDNLETELTEK